MRERWLALALVVVWIASLAAVWVAASAVLPARVESGGVIRATLVVDGGAWAIRHEARTENATAFGILREASVVQGFGLDWVDYDWPYEDVFVTSINGTRNNGAANLWWQYCVNGAYADVGALHRGIRHGDVVRWVYTAPGGDELCG